MIIEINGTREAAGGCSKEALGFNGGERVRALALGDGFHTKDTERGNAATEKNGNISRKAAKIAKLKEQIYLRPGFAGPLRTWRAWRE